MFKTHKITLWLLLFFLQIQVFAQFADLPIQEYKRYYKGNIILNYKVLERKIQRAYKHSSLFSSKDTTLKLLVYFRLYTNDPISKEEYLDGTFLKKLHYSNIRYRGKIRRWTIPKSIVRGEIYVYSKEEVVAFFSYSYKRFISPQEFYEIHKKTINPAFNINSYEEWIEYRKNSWWNNTFVNLVNYIWDKGKLFIFQLAGIGIDTYFIINEQLEISVFFEESDEQYNVLPIKEFVEKHWDRFSK